MPQKKCLAIYLSFFPWYRCDHLRKFDAIGCNRLPLPHFPAQSVYMSNLQYMNNPILIELSPGTISRTSIWHITNGHLNWLIWGGFKKGSIIKKCMRYRELPKNSVLTVQPCNFLELSPFLFLHEDRKLLMEGRLWSGSLGRSYDLGPGVQLAVASLQERRREKTTQTSLSSPTNDKHWLNPLSRQTTKEPTDTVKIAEYPGAKKRLKRWRMDLGGQKKGIQ